ncbi:DUF998 domain-containing protein [Thermopolyspora sp. NPDC052614]|uniref:DUF998 domain-containing protein n=1 Tax=Thermopolyspora sp. NPDC052614 TaxID=3155682 RepID=UPI0034349DE4
MADIPGSTLVGAAEAPRPRPVPVPTKPLVCGLIAGPLFLAVLLVLGATREGYDALRHPGSSLAIGDLGWTQAVNFVVVGVLTLAFAVGVRRVLRPVGGLWGPLLIGVWAVHFILAGVFTSDPVSGYPPGTPDVPVRPTLGGAIHDAAAVPGFVSLAAACLVFAWWFAVRGERGWAVYSGLSGVAFGIGLVLSSVGFAQVAGLVEIAGLLQRGTAAIGFAWLSLLAVRLLRAPVRERRRRKK